MPWHWTHGHCTIDWTQHCALSVSSLRANRQSCWEVAAGALRCRWGWRGVQKNKRAKHMVLSAYASQHHTSSLPSCLHTHAHTVKKCKIYQPRSARVQHVLGLWTLIFMHCIAHKCNPLVHNPIYITRWGTLKPAQLHKVMSSLFGTHLANVLHNFFLPWQKKGRWIYHMAERNHADSPSISTYPPSCHVSFFCHL